MPDLGCIRLAARCRGLTLSAIAATAILLAPDPTRADLIVGTLSTSVGANIPSADLATWITNDLYPNEQDPYGAQSLVVLTECFGGNTAQAFMPNANYRTSDTAVLSATSPNQLAYYGFYDVAAAKALKPAPNTTAQDVHNAGIAGKIAQENPTTSGGLAPNGYSLTPSSASGFIQGRQVLVYAGSPGGKAPNSDLDIRNTIAANWNNKLDTVSTIGSTGGTKDWTNEGSAHGLKSAIDTAASAIKLANALNPGPERQFILDVTDHGGVRNVAKDLNRSAPNLGVAVAGSPLVVNPTTRTVTVTPRMAAPLQVAPNPMNIPAGFHLLTKGFETLGGIVTNQNVGQGSPGTLPTQAELNSPRFSVLIPSIDNVDNNENPLITPATMLHMGGQILWQLLLVDPMTNQSLLVNDSFQEVYNPSGGANFLPGDDPNHDAGIRIDFLLSQADFPLWFFNRTFDVYLANYTNVPYNVGEFAQENPQLSPVSLPEPPSGVLCSWALVIALVIASRRRRTMWSRILFQRAS